VNQQRTDAMDCGLRRFAARHHRHRVNLQRMAPIFAMRFSVALCLCGKPPQSAIRNPQSIAPLTGAGLASFNNECSSNRERREKYETNVAKG
jgi:hypothetical protein